MRKIIDAVLEAAVAAVRPENFIPDAVKLSDGQLHIGGRSYRTADFDHIFAVSIGKAAVGMAKSLNDVLGTMLDGGVILTKHFDADENPDAKFEVLMGNHPVPGIESIASTKRILTFLENVGEKDFVIFLISGGGSALLTCPREGISFEDWQSFSKVMLGCGASIQEFNALRKHLDLAKGGGLALHALPAQTASVILSDVVGNPLDIIASGPTVPDPQTYADALAVVDKYRLSDKLPVSVLSVLYAGAAGKISETLKPHDERCAAIYNYLAADNHRAVEAACEKARALGFSAEIFDEPLVGDAEEAGKRLPEFFERMPKRSMLVFGGETTVRLTGNGIGGRNLHLALSSVREMAGRDGEYLVSFATDGDDGISNAAGAIVDSGTFFRGPQPEIYLCNNDSFNYFRLVGGLLQPGPTGTNVNDLTFLIRE